MWYASLNTDFGQLDKILQSWIIIRMRSWILVVVQSKCLYNRDVSDWHWLTWRNGKTTVFLEILSQRTITRPHDSKVFIIERWFQVTCPESIMWSENQMGRLRDSYTFGYVFTITFNNNMSRYIWKCAPRLWVQSKNVYHHRLHASPTHSVEG